MFQVLETEFLIASRALGGGGGGRGRFKGYRNVSPNSLPKMLKNSCSEMD